MMTFDTVAKMKEASLAAGIEVKTKGFNSIGDNGDSTYKIFTAQSHDGFGDHELLNGNIAVLQHNGSVLLEQFGITVEDGSYTGELNAAVNHAEVKHVTCLLSAFSINIVAFVSVSGITVDLMDTVISYTGDYDVYAQFGISTDRSIGLINSRGAIGTATTAVASSITDGTNLITVIDSTDFTVGDYIQLDIVYPRRSRSQVTQILTIDGNDITIDYTFGWTVTSCSIVKIDTMLKDNHFNMNIIDDSAATVDANKIAGVSFQYSANCSASWEVSNNNYAACTMALCQDMQLHDGTCNIPKDLASGRGYNVQISNSNRVDAIRLISRKCRHAWDLSGGSYCTIRDSYAYSPLDNIFQYTTHGIYEHDIVQENCYQLGGQNAISVAQSGIAFGSQTRRYHLVGGRYEGAIKTENAKQTLIKDVDQYGTWPTAETQFSTTEGTRIENVKFNDLNFIKISLPDVTTAPDGAGNATDFIEFVNCDFGANKIEMSKVTGSVYFDGCKNFGTVLDTDIDGDYCADVSFNNCELEITTSWELNPTNSVRFMDCDIDVVTSFEMVAGVYAHMTGCFLDSVNTNKRLKFNAPSVIASNCTTKNSVGIHATQNCKSFTLSNINCIEPDASHSSNQFTTESTTDCSFTLNGMNVKYTGSGNVIWFTNATLQAMMTGSYVEGTITIGTIADSIFAGNITPDTILP